MEIECETVTVPADIERVCISLIDRRNDGRTHD